MAVEAVQKKLNPKAVTSSGTIPWKQPSSHEPMNPSGRGEPNEKAWKMRLYPVFKTIDTIEPPKCPSHSATMTARNRVVGRWKTYAEALDIPSKASACFSVTIETVESEKPSKGIATTQPTPRAMRATGSIKANDTDWPIHGMREIHPSSRGNKHMSATNDNGIKTDQIIDRHRDTTRPRVLRHGEVICMPSS